MAEGGTCQDTERNGSTEAHSLSGVSRKRAEKGTCQGKKETDGPRRTDFLETADRGTCQDMKRNRPTETHSLSEDDRGTCRDTKETDRPRHTHNLGTPDGGTCQDTENTDELRHTHVLEIIEGGTCQDTGETNRAGRTHVLQRAEGGACKDTERNRSTEAHSLPGEGRRRCLLVHGKKPTGRGALTSWRRWKGGVVRTRKQTDRPRHTHSLETADRACQNRKKLTDRGALTP